MSIYTARKALLRCKTEPGAERRFSASPPPSPATLAQRAAGRRSCALPYVILPSKGHYTKRQKSYAKAFEVKHLILAIRYYLQCKATLRKAPKLIAGALFF